MGLRLPRLMVASVIAAIGLVPGGAAHAVATHPAVISLGLASHIPGGTSGGRTRFHVDRAQRIRLEIVSDRDVSRAVRHLGGDIRVNVGGTVIAASVPAGSIEALARLPGVRTLFPVRRLRAEDDRSVADIGANRVWALQDPHGLPVQGQHVLIGIVDGGVDYHSPDFKNPDGSSRIRAIWDQTASGHPPAGFSFGTECDTASINAATCPERDDVDGHGTHVLGIAAGNGRTSTPPSELGVAPQADIIIVKSDLQTDNIIAAWKYLVNKARALGEPIVINNSFGDQDGPHDGSEPDALAIDRLAGPGRLFVKSAGNAGNQRVHAAGTVRRGHTMSINLTATGYSDGFELEAFYSVHSALAFTMQNMATGQRFGPVTGNAGIHGRLTRKRDIEVSVQSGRYSGAYREIDVVVQSASHRPVRGKWRVSVQGPHLSGPGTLNAWLQDTVGAEFAHPSERDTISEPGDAASVITVGNYATSTSWRDMNNNLHQVCDDYLCSNGVLHTGDIAASSSDGPTTDGRHKPDIAAPGTMITSTLSHDAPVCQSDASDNCIDPAQISPDGQHLTYTGTSMAAPHVTGTLALMLQVNPTLDPTTADRILAATARHDAFTGSSPWTTTFGAGKLDSYAAVRQLLTAKQIARER